ncbi:MAG: hypothetical protein ACT4PY_01010 [Armatimonadota bacterium]
MWDDLRPKLPAHLRLHVTARFVELACARCGWLEVLVRNKTTPEQVLDKARDHRCMPDTDDG